MWKADELLQIEKQHCLSGKLPSGDSADALLYRAQIGEGNPRKAEVLAFCGTVTPLLKIRALITRGKLADADRFLLQAQSESSDPLERVELLLEAARLASFRGDYLSASLKASTALELQPSPTSALTLLQVRSLALYELGDWAGALADLEFAESFASVLPKAESGFYARILQTKVVARAHGLSEARKLFGKLWSNQDWSLDSLLSLTRLAIDLQRLDGKAAPELAIACYQLSRQLGDQLYSALALIDLHYSVGDSERARIAPLLEPAKKEFSRVQALCDEAEGKSELMTTSGHALRLQQADSVGGAINIESDGIFFSQSKRLLLFKEAESVREVGGKMSQALVALSYETPISKAAFFSALWGRQKYSPRLHDNLIWNLLSRMKKDFKITASIESDQISMGNPILRVAL